MFAREESEGKQRPHVTSEGPPVPGDFLGVGRDQERLVSPPSHSLERRRGEYDPEQPYGEGVARGGEGSQLGGIDEGKFPITSHFLRR